MRGFRRLSVAATLAVCALLAGGDAGEYPTPNPSGSSAGADIETRRSDEPSPSATASPGDVELWAVWETRVDVPAADDASLVARFSGPDGTPTTVRAVRSADGTMLVRFRPDQPGRWEYELRLADAPIDGHRGSFEVQPSRAPTDLARRGPVRVAEGSTWFEHGDGTPFLWIADTVWSGALLSDDDDWDRYLADRVAKGFTTIQVVLTPWRAAPTNAEGQVAFSTDPTFAIHPAFFERVDARISAANRAGLLVAAVVLWANGAGASEAPAQLPDEDAAALAQYLVDRYRAHHIVWLLAGDVRITAESASRWSAIAGAVFDGRRDVASMHPVGRDWPYPAMTGNDDWMSFLGYQSGHGDSEEALRWIYEGPHAADRGQRPIVNLELPYEGHLSYDRGVAIDAYAVRRAAYWSVLSTPAAGVSYGAHGLWSWESMPREPVGHAGSGVAVPWHEALELPGSDQMGHLAGILRSLDWWTLTPAPDLLESQPGVDDPARHIAIAQSDIGDVMLYTPQGDTVRLRGIDPTARAEWIDPRTGVRHGAKPIEDGQLEAPDDSDWVLVVTAP